LGGSAQLGSVIVDCHTHLLPDRLAVAIRRFFSDHGVAEFHYPLDHREVLDRHLADGINTVWNLPYAHKSGMARALNASMIEVSAALADHPVDVVPGCTVHPDDGDPVAEFTDAVDAGARVLKLHCSVGAYEADDPRLGGVLDAAGDRGVPVVIHAGHGVDGFTAAEELAPIGRAAEQHRGTAIILAHFGHHAFDDAVELLGEHSNLIADLTPVTFSPVPITAEVADRYADRILFGTDAPNCGHPASHLLDLLRSTGASEATLESICSGNARRLLSATA
jgi:predicted TIM-barrel fold metal-dependent hydrolase